ncbi:MAG TPA: HAD family phosphatase [Verrucomicrobiae bacterium]|jgi:HAD superfamily hydrolase (TIGR01509 family)|nr:HAD family phosphatase [Verrucomicrobiae bacterium]
MLPTVVFDLGKVLLDFDYSIAAHRIAEKSRSGVDEARFFIDQSPLLHRYETGLVTTQEFFAEICRLSGFSGTADEFAEFFSDIFAPIQPMIQLQAELRQAGIRTYIFSNTNDLAICHIRERFPFFNQFDGYILSYEHRSMKPDAKLYEIVERETRSSGREIIYLDDRLENVEAGRNRDWQAILHESPEKSRTALKQLGLPV